ncbi:unnamed protein product [Phytomonas sp. EM1]|nr:unnamed protein product [Phytomonas sp. EM1]|eukprot:CCW65880.1 unnamed protein product [Phytomonas sp. isolate EM1]
MAATYMSLAIGYREHQTLSRRVLRDGEGARIVEREGEGPSLAMSREAEMAVDRTFFFPVEDQEGGEGEAEAEGEGKGERVLPFLKPRPQPGEGDPSGISTRAAKETAAGVDFIRSIGGAEGAAWYRSEVRNLTRRARILPPELWSTGEFRDIFYGYHVTPEGEMQKECVRRQEAGRAMLHSSVMFDHFTFPRTPEDVRFGKRVYVWL